MLFFCLCLAPNGQTNVGELVAEIVEINVDICIILTITLLTS